MYLRYVLDFSFFSFMASYTYRPDKEKRKGVEDFPAPNSQNEREFQIGIAYVGRSQSGHTAVVLRDALDGREPSSLFAPNILWRSAVAHFPPRTTQDFFISATVPDSGTQFGHPDSRPIGVGFAPLHAQIEDLQSARASCFPISNLGDEWRPRTHCEKLVLACVCNLLSMLLS